MSNPSIPEPVWEHEVSARGHAPVGWLWHGFVAMGNLTLLTSLPKAGKTTLISLLLSRRNHGGCLAGLDVKPGKTVVVTEEDEPLWAERIRTGDFGGKVCFFSRPFLHIPTPAEWQALVDRILGLRQEHGIDLAVIDPLAPFLKSENLACNIFEVLLPLRALTRAGMGIIAAHHPSKRDAHVGLAARGSSALVGHVDVSMEMRHPGGDPLTRCRRFFACSRHAQTPRQLLLELNPEGTDYVAAADVHDDDFSSGWDVLHMVMEDAPQKLTRHDILGEWPPDFDKPSPAALWRWLDRAVGASMLAREGTGRKADPFRYWLPEKEAVWKENPLYELLEQQRRELNLPFVSLHEHKRRSVEKADPRQEDEDVDD